MGRKLRADWRERRDGAYKPGRETERIAALRALR